MATRLHSFAFAFLYSPYIYTS